MSAYSIIRFNDLKNEQGGRAHMSRNRKRRKFRKPPENVEIVEVEKQYSEDYGNGIVDSWSEKRYVIVDADTGEVFDDAQGYGYKSKQKAHAALGYMRTRASGKPTRKMLVKSWCRRNPDFVKELSELVEWNFKELARGEFTPDEIFEAAKAKVDCEDLPKGITPKLLLQYWE